MPDHHYETQHQTEVQTIETNGLEFRALTLGNGERYAFHFHGFPDDPRSHLPLMDILAEDGFTCIAPWIRGYGETERPPLTYENYGVDKLGADILDLVDAFDAEDPLIVGHDWGAIASTSASLQAPESIGDCVTIAVPPDFVAALDDHPRQILRSWYMALFQIPGASEELVRRNDFALIRRIWDYWSPGWDYDEARLNEVRDTFRTGKTVEAALMIYRAFFNDYMTITQSEAEQLSIDVPTLLMTGKHDGCIGADMFENSDRVYENRFELDIVSGAGHFAHAERPEYVADRILAFVE